MAVQAMSRAIVLPHGRVLRFERPLIMGIINATPDSFSDGGLFLAPDAASAHGLNLIAEGADILDIGGESTRPNAAPVDADEELRRVLPIVAALRAEATPISVDTMKAKVAFAAIATGASIINDVWGFQRDPDMARAAVETGAFSILMHNRERVDESVDMVEEVVDFLSRSIDRALAAGAAQEKLAVDPGFGFGKSHRQSLALVRNLPRICALGFPVLLGVSRKRAIGWATGRADSAQRLAGSLACGLLGLERGASILRVHDVAPHVDAIAMREAVLNAGEAA